MMKLQPYLGLTTIPSQKVIVLSQLRSVHTLKPLTLLYFFGVSQEESSRHML